jgi:transcription antitermination factor NusG
MTQDSRWYVVHTYSGYENKVKANIEKIIENRGMHDLFEQVVVPVQDTIEMKNGQKKIHPAQDLSRLCSAENDHDRRHVVYRSQHPGSHQLCWACVQAHPSYG